MGIFRKYALAAVAAMGMTASQSQASVIIDLVGGNTGTSNGSIYNWASVGSTGTGTINPFLRIQGNGTEQGYNHSVGVHNVPWETKTGIWTHDVRLSDLVAKTIAGVGYYEFLLDINQTANKPLLSLNMVQIFTRSTAIAAAPNSLVGLGTLRFNMDIGAQGDTTIRLDATRNPGSGGGDMFMYVPANLFAGASATDFVYFYSMFGADAGYVGNDGFEEWATVKPGPTTTSVPEPSTLAMILVSLLSLLGFGHRMSRSARA